jgi:hypothetical protein
MADDGKINALECPYDEESVGIPPRWEHEHVGRRLVKAFVTLDRLPARSRPARARRPLAAAFGRLGGSLGASRTFGR